MARNSGINQVIPIRVTFGGATTAFDFRKLLNESGDLVCFRVYDKELPAELKEEFKALISKIGTYAESNEKKAKTELMKDTLNIFNAREDLNKDPETADALSTIGERLSKK